MQRLNFLNLIVDDFSVCPYIEGQTARMPLSLPSGELTPEQFDQLLQAGYRRSGWYFYRTNCPKCSACEPLRIEVSEFRESRSLRRVRRAAQEQLRLEIAPPTLDRDRLALFNLHRQKRKLDRGEAPADEDDYTNFLVNSFCQVQELSYWYGDQLAAVSITDVGAESLSAVYCYFDPQFSGLSLGTYSILQQITLAQKLNKKWLYLGMFVAENTHLCYKARFGPHERLIAGEWKKFEPQVVNLVSINREQVSAPEKEVDEDAS